MHVCVCVCVCLSVCVCASLCVCVCLCIWCVGLKHKAREQWSFGHLHWWIYYKFLKSVEIL